MPWWAILFLALPPLLVVLAMRRLVRYAQKLRDPVAVGTLLSEPTRQALVRAGLDPDHLDLMQLKDAEDLHPLVTADLRRGLSSALLGAGRVRPVASAAAPPRALDRFDATSSSRPPPIDVVPDGGRVRTALVLAVVACAIAAWLLLDLG